ncbi:MAG: acyl--CoA ligase [Oscillospiraceae bacterium]|jgi:long-chain acyl-CoA synthetase|nr:acyl--CoA ligase [Oscillospiraceae bacterium]
MKDERRTLDYPDCSMSELVLETAERYPDAEAYDFSGVKTTYRVFAEQIRQCARALTSAGIGSGDRVTLCLPNCPQAVILFYAVNLVGAVANMVHPLSAQEEIALYLNASGSVAAVTLDRFYPKFAAVLDRTGVSTMILTDIDDGLRGIKRAAYKLAHRRGFADPRVTHYRDFIRGGAGRGAAPYAPGRGDDVAAILYSGGTSGAPKGILLTNLNFNALAMQTAAAGACIVPGHVMLAILPIFHGFGLGVCIHTAFVSGVAVILVPQFSMRSYAGLLRRYKPHYIAGVPTLYEALLRMPGADELDMSRLEGVFSGGDSLSPELKRRVDAFLRERGASVQIREGYGLTECVTASCLTPRDVHREGSIGVPFPDTLYKIVTPGTDEHLPFGQIGEICISGPTVMKGYDGDPEETALALRTHGDGRVWLHTGDLGAMDADGYVYFRQRLKRMIISSGYSIYPSRIEDVLSRHAGVRSCCVIGVPDDFKMERPKAFIVPNDGFESTDALKADILAYCERNIAKYAIPYELEFRESLPLTLVGKTDYAALEREERARGGVKPAERERTI